MHLLSSFSLWWILPIFFTTILVSWLFYRNESWLENKSKQLKYSLITIRTLSLSLIIILLLGLLLEQSHFQTQKPIILTLIDRSSSMLNYKDSKNLDKTINEFQNELELQLGKKFNLKTWNFGHKLHWPSKGFDAQQTNMQIPFEAASNLFLNANLGAVVLISDGNYNAGSHPMYAAEHLPLSTVYSLAVGDTNLKKDLVLTDVAYNDLTFLNNNFPIEVDIEAQRFAGKAIQVDLYENGKKIQSKNLTLPNKRISRQTLAFECNASKIGIQEYKIQIQGQNGEFSFDNNHKTIYIEVLDSRSKILIYSFAPHPDVAALQQALSSNQLNEVVVAHSRQINELKINAFDLLIWHDPGLNFNNQLFSSIEKNNLPVWYILGTQTDQIIASKIGKGLIFDIKQQSEEVQATTNPGFSIYEPDPLWQNLMGSLPPLTKRFGDVKAKNGLQVLYKQRLAEIIKDQPLLGFYQNQQRREAYLIGEGIWRWRLIAYLKKQQHAYFDAFVNEISSYLMIKKEGSGLRVKAPKKISTLENCILNASFYNEALKPISSPVIEWELKDDKNKVRKGTFLSKGDYFQQQLGKLKPGRYYWKASTTFNQKKYMKTGAFIVEDIRLEQLESTARHGTLYQLAKQSSGEVYPIKAYRDLIQTLKRKPDLVEVRTETHQFDPVIDLLWILILILGLLFVEWFLRRYNGSY